MPGRFLVHDVAVAGPATHALVIGVGAYPHLDGGSGRLTPDHDGMGQLTSPPISARSVAAWLMRAFNHPKKLATVALLTSEATPTPFAHPNDPAQTFAVDGATLPNVSAAVQEWFRRGNEHEDNLMLFYFCGHGISAGTETALLLADYGADTLNALNGAVDFRRLRLGMRQCRATEQCFFVDACRASSDTLIDAGFAGTVIIQPRPRNELWPRLRAPVFYASMMGDKAYALPGQPSVFADALLKAFQHFAADDEEGDWRISTDRLQGAVEHLVTRRMRDLRKVQVPTSDDQSKIHLHYLSQPPNALVYVTTEPSEALHRMTLGYRSTGGAPVDAPADGRRGLEWELEVPAGSYDFIASLPAGPPVAVNNNVRPAYRRIKIPLPP